MPAKPAWLLHIPEIVTMLESFEVPVVDRASIERLFGLRRRRAIELLHHFGGYQAGRTFLIDRRSLIEQLKQGNAGEDFRREARRRERLEQAIEQLRRQHAAARIRIPVDPERIPRKLAELDAVDLAPGQLRIAFTGAADLLAKLYQLSQVAGNDFEGFCAAVESGWSKRLR